MRPAHALGIILRLGHSGRGPPFHLLHRAVRASGASPLPRAFHAIPVVDLAQAELEPEGLMRACQEVGVFYVRLTPAQDALCDAVLGAAEQFFSLPPEQKAQIHFDRSPHWRGYAPCGDETTAGRQDMREQIDFSDEAQAAQQGPDTPEYAVIRGPNQWPDSGGPAGGLRGAVERYREMVLCVSDALARALAGPGALRVPGALERLLAGHPYTRIKVVNYPNRAGTSSAFPSARYGVGPHKVCGAPVSSSELLLLLCFLGLGGPRNETGPIVRSLVPVGPSAVGVPAAGPGAGSPAAVSEQPGRVGGCPRPPAHTRLLARRDVRACDRGHVPRHHAPRQHAVDARPLVRKHLRGATARTRLGAHAHSPQRAGAVARQRGWRCF